ncbi:MAG TPA: hypothetical protein VFS62_16620 [Chloroflexota bacterium]|jgi:hypothetical protein|nr:hypothetical protein [Chloroflexota bacterium]
MDQANSANTSQLESPALPPATPVRRSRAKASSQRQLSDWQRFFLDRLAYLLQEQRSDREATEPQKLLLSKAVYSTYLDCQDQSVGDEALELITSASAAKPSAN